MSEHLSGVDDAQLERWAYARSTTPDEQSRAVAASAELQLRAALERERAERAAAERAAAEANARAVANGEVDDTASEHPEPLTDDERRHRRRMLATGIAGVTAAALALVGGLVVLSQPNSDPMAIFERDETQLDRDWTLRLVGQGFASQFTEGPRAIDFGDGSVAIAARVSTVPDGRSTPLDLYCLYVGFEGLEGGGTSLSSTCAYPEQFERDGLNFPQEPSTSGTGFDMVRWGPIGGLQRETEVPIEQAMPTNEPSVLFWMTYPVAPDPTFDVTNFVGDTSSLLMGPAVLPLLSNDADVRLFLDTEPTVSVYLTRGELIARGTQLCAHVTTADGPDAVACDLLTTVRRDGLDVPVTANGRSWLVRIGADGPDRTDTVELLE